MNPIATILSESRVLLGLEAGSKKRLLEEAGQLFESTCNIEQALVFENLLSREKLGSTGIGQGVAIPHSRIKGITDAVGAFIRLAEPLDYDAPDGKPVTLVFVLLAPEEATEASLQILAALATFFADSFFRMKLATAADAAAVCALFANAG
ncbi:MAG: PTS sugar transporter subunit IIA [Zoogloeaceae bacterium]|jgi:PTS system nitrogen regulatory IIA component|nr:PTS sugar transporter subunit IIA [Zoogloeaceae bacterium]